MSIELCHISPKEFLELSFQLGRKLFEAGIRPKHTISIWRGGTPVGLGVDAFYRTHGFVLNHTTIATESFHGIDQRGEVIVKGLDHLINVVCREDDLLIIDDVYESGRTIKAIVEALRESARANTPQKIYVGTIHSKPGKHEYKELPLIFVKEVEKSVWIDYPHELADLVSTEDPDDNLIKEKDENIWKLLHSNSKSVLNEKLEFEDIKMGNYLTSTELRYDAIKLGLHIAREHKYVPDFLIALWPGGVNAGLPIHEVYKYLENKGEIEKTPDHISLNTTSTHLTYRSNIIGLSYLMKKIEKHHNILLIEVAFKSGRLMSDVISRLKEKLRRNLTLENIKIATLYYNPEDKSTWTVRPFKTEPDFYYKKVDFTMVYPANIYRLENPMNDLKHNYPDLYKILYEPSED